MHLAASRPSAITSRPATGPWPGLGLAGLVAAAGAGLAALAGRAGVVVSPLVVALLLGLCLAQVWWLPAVLTPGLTLAGRGCLRVAIVLLGLRIGLPRLTALGLGGTAAIAAVVALTVAFGYRLARWCRLPRDLAWLLAAGHGICGAAAIAASEGILRARSRAVSQALTMVTLFGTVVMLGCPLLGRAFDLSPEVYGTWVGGSLHEVAQAVAAGFALGEPAGEVASLVKLVRVACLLPFGLVLAVVGGRRSAAGSRRPALPWFLVAFAAVAAVDAVGLVPAAVANCLRPVGDAAMAVAMAALGLQGSLRGLATGGWRPVVVAAATTLWISGLAFAVALWR